jgi:uncharacterized membrane protein
MNAARGLVRRLRKTRKPRALSFLRFTPPPGQVHTARRCEKWRDSMAETQTTPPAAPPPEPRSEDSDRTLAMVVYGLYIIAIFTGMAASIVGLILALVRKEGASPLYDNHYTYQIFTVVWGLVFFVVGLLTFWFLVGFLVWFIGWLWFIARAIIGLIRLMDGKSNPDPRTFLF